MGEQRHTRFTQTDIARAAKGMRQGGIEHFVIRIDPTGNIELTTAEAPAEIKKKGSSWDDLLDR